jgi:hypothetical protein
MIRPNWSSIVHSLVLIRLGQELGSDSRLARAIHDVIEIVVTFVRLGFAIRESRKRCRCRASPPPGSGRSGADGGSRRRPGRVFQRLGVSATGPPHPSPCRCRAAVRVGPSRRTAP